MGLLQKKTVGFLGPHHSGMLGRPGMGGSVPGSAGAPSTAGQPIGLLLILTKAA